MDEKIVKLLFDIKMAISEIDSFLSEKPVTIANYRNNQQLKRAVERDLEIIGEAVSKILSMERNFPLENAHKITGLRNQIIHAYDNISDEMI